jgi:hypothetical protein
MAAENPSAPPSQGTTTAAAPIHVTPSGLQGLKLFEKEIATYRRELPRLLEEGHAWRHALIKGDEILSVWDTQGDAIQAGRERFGPDAPIFIKTIDPRDPQRFALLDAWMNAQCPP